MEKIGRSVCTLKGVQSKLKYSMPWVNFKTHNSFYKKTPSVRRVFFLSVCTPAGCLYTQKVGLPQGVCTLKKSDSRRVSVHSKSRTPTGCLYTQKVGLPQGVCTLKKSLEPAGCMYTQKVGLPQGAFTLQKPQGVCLKLNLHLSLKKL
jgi:hypothetical protein